MGRRTPLKSQRRLIDVEDVEIQRANVSPICNDEMFSIDVGAPKIFQCTVNSMILRQKGKTVSVTCRKNDFVDSAYHLRTKSKIFTEEFAKIYTQCRSPA